MPARNSQNPTRKVTVFENKFNKGDSRHNLDPKASNIAGICSACKTEIPFKPGFRPSKLTCPKCNKPLGE